MQTIIVLGMHKSGTSLVAETLHHSGIAMVEALGDGGYDKGEKYERAGTGAINKALLKAEQAYSLDVRQELDRADADANMTVRARALVEDCLRAGADWGFKDPRTCLTWAFWKPLLPPHKLVCIFRDVGEVHQRYRTKPNFSAMRSMDAWYRYNDAMLRVYRAADPADRLLLDYHALMHGEAGMAALSALTGRTLADRRNPSLRRNASRKVRTWWDALRYRLSSGNSVWALSRELRRIAMSRR